MLSGRFAREKGKCHLRDLGDRYGGDIENVKSAKVAFASLSGCMYIHVRDNEVYSALQKAKASVLCGSTSSQWYFSKLV